VTALDTMTPRVAPHSPDAEKAVLGSVLLDNDAMLNEAVTLLAPGMFYRAAHATIWEAVLRVHAAGEPVDLVTLSEDLTARGQLDEVGTAVYLVGLSEETPSSAYAEHYARIVREKWVLREVIRQSSQVIREAYDGQIPLEDVLNRAAGVGGNLDVSVSGGAHGIGDVMNRLVQQMTSGTGDQPVPTGFRDLDDQLGGGVYSASLTVLAARPSMGKTALAVQVAENAARHFRAAGDGRRVAVVSLEMPEDQLAARQLSANARVDSNIVRQAMRGAGHFTERQWERIMAASEDMAALPLTYLDDSVGDANLRTLGVKLRRMHREQPLGLIVIDYLQLMNMGGSASSGENRQQEISNLSRSLKQLAREIAPVIVLSQLSRAVEQRPNHRPMLSDLRESGAIEQDADVVMFVYRDEYYNKETDQQGVAEIIIGKQRNGPVGTVKLQFQSAHVRFNDLSAGH
jgi:replicative DNA helicase